MVSQAPTDRHLLTVRRNGAGDRKARTAGQVRPVIGWGLHSVCPSVFPQCEQFVEQHTAELLVLVPRSRNSHVTCQVRPTLQQ